MPKAKASGIINASAEQVWELVGDFNGLDRFVEAITDSTVSGSGEGAVRILTLQDGGKVKEKLESLDNERRVLTYSIMESPMPIENYTGTLKVKELDNDRSEFSWSSTFEVVDADENELTGALEGLYELGIKGLQETF